MSTHFPISLVTMENRAVCFYFKTL